MSPRDTAVLFFKQINLRGDHAKETAKLLITFSLASLPANKRIHFELLIIYRTLFEEIDPLFPMKRRTEYEVLLEWVLLHVNYLLRIINLALDIFYSSS